MGVKWMYPMCLSLSRLLFFSSPIPFIPSSRPNRLDGGQYHDPPKYLLLQACFCLSMVKVYFSIWKCFAARAIWTLYFLKWQRCPRFLIWRFLVSMIIWDFVAYQPNHDTKYSISQTVRVWKRVWTSAPSGRKCPCMKISNIASFLLFSKRNWFTAGLRHTKMW